MINDAEYSNEKKRMKLVDQSNSLVVLHDKRLNEMKSNPRSPKNNVATNLMKVARKRSLI
jgi:hypothetical protein